MVKRILIPAEIHRVADEMGEFIVFWGFKRVHGRIWTHLILSSRPLDASDLMKRIGISKALVSMSVSEMLALDVIQETGKSEKGTQLYRANPDILNVILTVLKFREKELLAGIHKSVRDLRKLPAQKFKKHGLNSSNLSALNGLIEVAEQALESFMKTLRFDLSSARNFPLSQPGIKRALR